MTGTSWHAVKGAIARRVSELVSAFRGLKEEPEAHLPRVRAVPLAPFERDGVKAALRRAGLPHEDVEQTGPQFWRFDNKDDGPVGFGGLEMHGADALLRSVVTLPPLRRAGFGRAIVAAIEQEARLCGCDTIYLLAKDKDYFAPLGYAACPRTAVPEALRAGSQFTSQACSDAEPMVKQLAP